MHEAIAAYLAEQSGLVAGVLYGSAVSGRLRPDSDIDLALLWEWGHVPDFDGRDRLIGDLERIVRREVDLVFLNDTSTILAFQVIRTGTIVYCRDRRAYEQFMVRLVSEYDDFKRIRRPIEEAVLKRRVLRD